MRYIHFVVCDTGCDVMSLLNDEAIVIVNHQSTSDVPTLMYALQPKKNALKDVMWVQDMILKYLDFGWVSLLHGDFFLEQVMHIYFASLLSIYCIQEQLTHLFLTFYFTISSA